ncbi:outer membrane beta-barrel protein [Hymenobacter ruricola]|uniref:Outer membrane beta-barrel protein n=1 Tax=Hymenobacter ruricola TaxID=2791023 RepID=A0ABS0IAV6_9BACT|nr:outer membrane beta-barrel protein [Hymenobacter ruricola]MBF9224109.1 outer membrane beta-barrel protein [Hymenobacter ruricola]
MTDREPDDLYDALRRRLADYGQEPPAPLWATIRAQLPPPVAAPQLRKRRRRAAAALLLVLLAFVGAATWQWEHRRERPGTARQAVRPQPEGLAHRPPRPAAGGDTDAAPAPATASAPAARTAAGVAATQESAAPAVAPAAVAAQAGVRADASAGLPGGGPNHGLAVSTHSAMALATTSESSRKHRFAGRPNGPAGRSGVDAEGTAPSHRGPALGAVAAETAAARRTLLAATKRPAATGPAAEGKGPGATSAAATVAPPVAVAAVFSENMPASTAFVSPLALRPAALPTGVMAGRPARLPADTLPAAKAAGPRRWAVQLLGGPAYTYRHLTAAAPDGPGPVPNTLDANAAGTARERAEEARTGFALALQVRRVLNGRWSLSTGLGYQQYAMQRTYDVLTATRRSPGPVVSAPPQPAFDYIYTPVSSRDTYRFLTVPVRLSYALGRAGGKLRYGLLGGADAALYLGGRSAGADVAQHAWNTVDSGPNRTLNLSVSGGLDLRYRLASRLELLAQPSATYFLNSLSKPASGLTPRHLVGAGVVLGVSYDWR